MSRPSSSAPWIAVATLAVGAGLALIWSWHQRPAGPKPSFPTPSTTASSSPDTAARTTVTGPSTPLAAGDAAPAPATSPARDETPPPPGEASTGREQTLEAIQELAVTYDAASVPALARFLSNADAEIRAAARDGLIQLGERAAIPYLEEAARHATAEEANALREAAEFLALPTWTERRAALKARQTAP